MKKKHVFLVILVLIIATVGIIIFNNIGNILAIYDATKYTTEEIEQKMIETEQKTKDILIKHNQENIKPLSEEDAKRLADREISEEDAVKIIMSGKEEDKETQPEDIPKEENITQEQVVDVKPKTEEISTPKEEIKDTSTTDTVTENEQVDIDEKIGEFVAKIYVLKAKYNNLISDENYNVAADFYALPKEEQTREKKYQMGLTFMRTLKSFQTKCDEEMNAVLSELTNLLKENNMSTEIVDEINKTYEEEKKNKIAYFVSKYTAKESRVLDEVK